MENVSTSNYIEIFKGRDITALKSQKVIVFDLDETLGSFSDLNILWNKIFNKINICENDNDQEIFNEVLDLYPEFFRTNIFSILKYLYKKKKNGECKKVFIYTNNICGNKWCDMIVGYIHYKMRIAPEVLFDDIIESYHFDSRRTNRHKTYNDFVSCAMLSKNLNIGFIDNESHSKMKHEKVYYIKPRSYIHPYSRNEIADILTNSHIYKRQIANREFETEFMKSIRNYNSEIYSNYNIVDIENHIEENKMVSKKIMYYLKEFFYTNKFKKPKTQKINLNIGRFTRKYSKSKPYESEWI